MGSGLSCPSCRRPASVCVRRCSRRRRWSGRGVLMMQQPAGWRGLNWPGTGMSGIGVKCGRCYVKSEAQNHDVNRVARQRCLSACAAGVISKCQKKFRLGGGGYLAASRGCGGDALVWAWCGALAVPAGAWRDKWIDVVGRDFSKGAGCKDVCSKVSVSEGCG